jgi:class 3 adenylate cyclase
VQSADTAAAATEVTVDIGVWLRGLDLQQYEQAFRDNAIDFEVLAELTEADLEKLGVLLGHRKKILMAVAGLATQSAAGSSPTGQAPSEPLPIDPGAPGEQPLSQAERRQLTVMFVDLAGSTALSSQLDPEEMNMLLRAYQDAVAGEVGRFEGYVAKFMGDGVVVYFGWPRAHEDDAERAVRAARRLSMLWVD